MYRHIDAVGATNYEGWYEDTLAPPATVQAAHRRLARAPARDLPGQGADRQRVRRRGQRASTRRARPGSESFQASLLTRHIRTYEATPWLDGELVWNLQDFALAPSFAGGSIRRQVPGIDLVRGINQKGLFTYDGKAKPAVAAVRRAFGAELRRRMRIAGPLAPQLRPLRRGGAAERRGRPTPPDCPRRSCAGR